eukprot:SAG25_NODE_8770_length_405_cov_0.679739_1_plen_86_part_01
MKACKPWIDWFFAEFKLLIVTGFRVELDAKTQTCFQFGGTVEVLERPDEPSSGLAQGIGELFCTSVQPAELGRELLTLHEAFGVFK